MLVCMVILSPWSLKCFVMFFLSPSAWGPGVVLETAIPSSLYRPMFPFPYVPHRPSRIKRPTSSQISAPSKPPIVTSNTLLSFSIQADPLLNSMDFRACMMIYISLSVMLQYVLAKKRVFCSRFSVMEG